MGTPAAWKGPAMAKALALAAAPGGPALRADGPHPRPAPGGVVALAQQRQPNQTLLLKGR